MSEYGPRRQPWELIDWLYRALVTETAELAETAPIIMAARQAGDTGTVDRLWPAYERLATQQSDTRYRLWAAGWTEEAARRRDYSEALDDRRTPWIEVMRERRTPGVTWDGWFDPFFMEQEAPPWVA